MRTFKNFKCSLNKITTTVLPVSTVSCIYKYHNAPNVENKCTLIIKKNYSIVLLILCLW